jgi:integrase
LSLEEIQKTLQAFSGSEFEPIVRFYLGTGTRLGEGLSLTWGDIDFTRGQVIIKGINAKGKRNRVIPLKYSPGLLDMLSNSKRRKDGKVFGPFAKRGKEVPQWSEWWVGRHISNTLTSIGLPWATCHTFRHTFASHLVMAGVPLFTVQRLLGHAQIDTTIIYAHLAEDHNAEMMAKLPY